jgi:HPt (histidine-containing phosphotransfer) domain-containing protein
LSALNTGEVLGTHATNLIFFRRQELQLLSVERFTILRTVIADAFQTSPGWFWSKHWDENLTKSVLVDRSLHDPNRVVRQQALELLTDAGIPINEIEYLSKKEFIELILGDEFLPVVLSGLKYLASQLSPDDISTLRDAIAQHSSIPQEKALEAERLVVVRKGTPGDLRNLLPTLKSDSKEVIAEFTKRINELDESTLFAAARHASSSLRAGALRALARQDKLSEEELRQLLTDSSSEVKKAVYEEMIRKNLQVTSQDIRNVLPKGLFGDLFGSPSMEFLIFSLFKSSAYEDLVSKVDWFSLGWTHCLQGIGYQPL